MPNTAVRTTPKTERKARTMSREKQIEEMAKEICAVCHAYKNCVNTTPCTMAYKEAEELYKDKGYRKQEWISVEDRLPKESAWYLVNIINHFGLDVVTFTHYTKGFGWGVPDVAHWMPLPEPPKMKGGAE